MSVRVAASIAFVPMRRALQLQSRRYRLQWNLPRCLAYFQSFFC